MIYQQIWRYGVIAKQKISEATLSGGSSGHKDTSDLVQLEGAKEETLALQQQDAVQHMSRQ